MRKSLLIVSVSLATILGACGQSPEPRETVAPPRPTFPPPWTQTSVVPSPTPGPESQVVFPHAPPLWLGDPAVSALAVVIGDGTLCRETGTYSLLFLNAETGEQFEVTVPPARAMMWLNSTEFGLLTMDAQAIISIDLADGRLSTTSFEAEEIQLVQGTEAFPPEELDCTMTPLSVVEEDQSAADVIILSSPWDTDQRIVGLPLRTRSPRSSYSADLTLRAEVPSDWVDVLRVGTGETLWESRTHREQGELSELEFAWSPVDPTRLAVTQCDWRGTDRCFGQRLFVVDVTTGEELASYPGEFDNIIWSPDGGRILYQRPDWQITDWFSGPFCVLDPTNGENECIEDISLAHFPADLAIPQRTLFEVQWDRQGDGFYYTYMGTYLPSPPADLGYLSGLCHYSIATRGINCPSEAISELQGLLITNAVLSPDERFAYLQASPRHGVLDLVVPRFYQLPDPTGRGGIYLFDAVSALWRPLSTTSVSYAMVGTSRPTDQEMREGLSIWGSYGLEDELAPTSPGTRQFSVRVSPGLAFTWSYYWCALGPERLAANLESIAVEFTIDGVEVARADVLEFDDASGEWACHYWATLLSGWESGSRASLMLTLRLDRSLSDGADTYEAGDYSFEILAYVDD